jgi:predicted CoA-substrate-specific enzyme activase
MQASQLLTISEDYRSMWADLGLDLEAHDALLGVLGQTYQDIYLSQKNRPEGMGYFDFVMSEVHELRIKELLDEKAAGHKIIGSYCVFVPEEIVLAANATLVGLCSGADFATEDVEKLLPRNTCALIKSSFGFKIGKVCPDLESADMIVGENTCDGKKKAYESLNDLVENLSVMDLPQVKSENGKVKKFEMNDRCAAGTGKFLEIMAKTLEYDIEEFGREALLAENELNISSMCTVFAESEVTSLIAKGNNRREIARGLHASVIRRAAGMINRVSSEGDIVFTGGVAKNPCMVAFLAKKLEREVLIPENPQFIGALGAALLAADMN